MTRACWILFVIACGSSAQVAPPVEAPPAEAAGPNVRVRVADEAGLTEVDPAITRAMEAAVRDAYTTAEQAEAIRTEAVIHDLSTDAAGRRARVRVTLVRMSDERICTVLEGGAQAAQATELEVIEASMRSALRSFASEMSDCLRVDQSTVSPNVE